VPIRPDHLRRELELELRRCETVGMRARECLAAARRLEAADAEFRRALDAVPLVGPAVASAVMAERPAEAGISQVIAAYQAAIRETDGPGLARDMRAAVEGE